MAEYKNEDHFNIGGDKTVKVTLVFDVGERASDETIMRCASDYMMLLVNSNMHKSWGRSIRIEDV